MEISALRLRYESAWERLALFAKANPEHPKVRKVRDKMLAIPRIIPSAEERRRQ